jgi:hypothetical protein
VSGSVSGEELDVLAAYEQLYWTHGGIPTEEKVSDLCGVRVETIKRYWQKDEFRDRIQKRGIDLNASRTEGLLTLQQLDIVNRMLNVADNRSKREKLAEVGVSTQQFTAWMRQPAFRDYVSRRAEEMFKGADAEAYQALVGAVENGDMTAVRFFFEMRGIYNPRLQVDVNIESVLVRVVEVISRHVRDPQILQAIAADLEILDVTSQEAVRQALPQRSVAASGLDI